MKHLLGLMTLIIPTILFSQTGIGHKGIKWTEGLSWEQVKTKAKVENKYIFLDVFATWCEPCRAMEKNTYSNDTVGNAVNNKFISVKVQADTNRADKDYIKSWYADASNIMQQYKITAFPTFLFFSPDGKLVHKDLGFKKASEFVALVNDATLPQKQYYTLKANYEQGVKDYAAIPALIEAAKKFEDKDFAIAMARDYTDNYLMKLSENELYTKKNLEFIAYNLQSSQQKAFELFTSNAKRANAITEQKDLSSRVIDYIIYKEEIAPAMKEKAKVKGDLDWKAITKAIKKKYGEFAAEKNVMNAKVGWYNVKKMWTEFADALISQTQKYGVDTSNSWGDFGLNNGLWDVFLHCNGKKQLTGAIRLMEGVMRRNPGDGAKMDTYANLLYKVGRKEEALKWEEKAVNLLPGNKDLEEALDKMRKELPTWSTE